MSHETSKAVRRRFLEDKVLGSPFWEKIFAGDGVDVGSGDDPLPFVYCEVFDKEQGDAQFLSQYLPENKYDYIHASQVVEHLPDPLAAVKDWHKLLREDGYLIMTVPSWELYEGMVWPSRWNPEHKSTWSLWQKGSPAQIHIFVPQFLIELKPLYSYLRADLIDTNYDYSVAATRDQTVHEELGVEAFIEIVLRKK